jgi:Tryptophan-associated transmembrane protein (Trp_oprn_chp)
MSGIVVLGRELTRWQTRRVREANGLRVASLALVVGGALLAAGSTTIVWVTTGLRSDPRGLLDLEFRGLDLAQGVAALIISGLTLALFLIARRGRGDTRLAVVLLLSGVALVALPAWVALRAEDRAVEEVAQVVASSAGITVEEATERVRTEPDLAVRTDTTGVWPSIAAGVLVTIGGVTTLSWIGRRPADPDDDGP